MPRQRAALQSLPQHTPMKHPSTPTGEGDCMGDEHSNLQRSRARAAHPPTKCPPPGRSLSAAPAANAPASSQRPSPASNISPARLERLVLQVKPQRRLTGALNQPPASPNKGQAGP